MKKLVQIKNVGANKNKLEHMDSIESRTTSNAEHLA